MLLMIVAVSGADYWVNDPSDCPKSDPAYPGSKCPDPATNLKRNLLDALTTVLDGLNPATGVPPDNLRAGLSAIAYG